MTTPRTGPAMLRRKSRRRSISTTARLTSIVVLLLTGGGASAFTTVLPSARPTHRAPAPVRVMVSILPQTWFVEWIGGDLVRTDVLVGPGHSPATYEPTPRQMADLQKADVFFSAGVPFERGLLPRIAELQRKPFVVGPGTGDADVGDHDGHDHGEIDPHTWLDPIQARRMSREIASALIHVRPEARAFFTANLHELEEHLGVLDAEIARMLAPCRDREFYVFHPAFGHFAARYGLRQQAVESGGHEPGSRHLAEVISAARRAGVRAIVVQPQFSRRSAAAVARAVGADVVALDPLAPDYDVNLRRMAATLYDILGTSDTADGERTP